MHRTSSPSAACDLQVEHWPQGEMCACSLASFLLHALRQTHCVTCCAVNEEHGARWLEHEVASSYTGPLGAAHSSATLCVGQEGAPGT